MITVHKFDIDYSDLFYRYIPEGSAFLKAEMQGGFPRMWWQVNTDAPMVVRAFGLFGTGEEVDSVFADAQYLDSFQANGGLSVYHLFGGHDVHLECMQGRPPRVPGKYYSTCGKCGLPHP